jgi:hypothetical protein
MTSVDDVVDIETLRGYAKCDYCGGAANYRCHERGKRKALCDICVAVMMARYTAYCAANPVRLENDGRIQKRFN